MNADELVKKIIAYGADEEGINDRFGDNTELYEVCFREFLREPAFDALEAALADRDYTTAFEAAHALKGLSGNLGLTVFYEKICVLVESLRAHSTGNVTAEHAEVKRQLEKLKVISSDTPQEPHTDEAFITPASEAADEKADIKKSAFLPTITAVVVLLMVLVCIIFATIGNNYRNNILNESGQHLIEMSNQIKLYIEDRIDYDWRLTESIRESVLEDSYTHSDENLLRLLQRKTAVWEVDDLVIYTENGYSVHSNGTVEKNDLASDIAVRAHEQQRYLTVVDSQLLYTIPIETELTMNGSKIVAISAVRDMETFIDDMRFTSFEKQALIYLTGDDGVVISMLNSELALPVFNFSAVIGDSHIESLSLSSDAEEIMSATVPGAFLMSYGKDTRYVVSLPISAGNEQLRLFFVAPEELVNRTMNSFSGNLTLYSVIIIVLFTVLAVLAFIFMYRSRKKLFDDAIIARERMFDLLVENTRTAFALFKVNEPEPLYVSSNAASVIGERFWVIEKSEDGYRMHGTGEVASDTVIQANAALDGWDGKTPFKSGYIKNDMSLPPCYFEFELYPTEDESCFVGIAQDVTRAYDREQVTRSAMEMATRSNEAKSRFLSNMSHDIRTPMNAIINMTDFALESIDQPKKLGTYLHTIRESSEHLLHLINDVLDMSRIERGQTVVASEPFDIRAEIQRQADILRPICTAKNQTLITDFSGITEPDVLGDALKFSQIVMNLLSNAVKFTPEHGAVRLTAAQTPSLHDDITDFRIIVEDNGIGISPENIARIFEPFYRTEDRRINGIEGTGLGLSICKGYVEAMGGTIRCESEHGEGSIFTVDLFFRKADKTEKPLPDAHVVGTPFLGMRCLVVEDNSVNRMIAKTMLERLGFIVDFAVDGGDGVTKFLRSRPGAYDIIYMDIQMPVLDGCEATVRIRSSRHPQAKSVPIIAMTANVFAEDIEKARIAGMDAFLGKPIVSFELAEQTRRVLRGKEGQ